MTGLLWAAAGLAAGAAGAYAAFRARESRRARYLSFLGHELGGGLNGVYLTARNLELGVFGELSEDIRPWVSTMVHAVERASDRQSELNDWARIEFGRPLSIETESVDAAELTERPLDYLRDLGGRSGVAVEAEIEPFRVRADPDRARRVFAAMLELALRGSPKGGSVKVRGALRDGRVLLEVSFQKPEGAEAELARAFERYFLSDLRGGESFAFGGGLWLMREVARRLGGDFEAGEGGPGETRLRLALPSGGDHG